MNYNPKIHHRHSIRLKGYDYLQAEFYFITICVQDRICLFGKIENDELVMNQKGKIADNCWVEIPKHFPNAVLHEHIVMPNHVHGIIELIKTGSPNESGRPVGVQNFEPLQSPNESGSSVGVQNFEPLPNISPQNEFRKIIPHSIGSIIRGYKIGITNWFRNNTDIEKVWQRNYYEHIIRNEKSYHKISEYIINNPKNWKDDDFFNFT